MNPIHQLKKRMMGDYQTYLEEKITVYEKGYGVRISPEELTNLEPINSRKWWKEEYYIDGIDFRGFRQKDELNKWSNWIYANTDEKGRVNHNKLAKEILKGESIITLDDTLECFYFSEKGIYEKAESFLKGRIQEITQNRCTRTFVAEIIDSIKRMTLQNRSIFDLNPNYIPLENGIFDLEKMEIMPYTPLYDFSSYDYDPKLKEKEKQKYPIFRKKHPIIFDPLSQCPKIEKFLNQVMEENETEKTIIKEMIGYTFHRIDLFQSFFILRGEGANGKGTILRLTQRMLGDECFSGESLHSICESDYGLASLDQMNANIFDDLSDKGIKDVSKLKILTGGQTSITINQKYLVPYKTRFFAKLIASCNVPPKLSEDTRAIWRRIVLIEFKKQFEEDPNRNLDKELQTEEEISAFFNECIFSYKLAIQRNNWIRNENIDQKKARYKLLAEPIEGFIDEMLEEDEEGSIAKRELYEIYKQWSEERKIMAKNDVWFFKGVRKHFNAGSNGENIYWERKDLIDDKGRKSWSSKGISWKEEGVKWVNKGKQGNFPFVSDKNKKEDTIEKIVDLPHFTPIYPVQNNFENLKERNLALSNVLSKVYAYFGDTGSKEIELEELERNLGVSLEQIQLFKKLGHLFEPKCGWIAVVHKKTEENE